jgi:hypothetical protein
MKKILIHFLTSALLISIPLASLTTSMYTVTTIAKAGKKIEWSSSNNSIVTVNKAGLVKAKKKGKGRIMAKYNKKTYTCNVTVKNKNISKPDPYDGDVSYPVSFAFAEKNSAVTYGKVNIDKYFSNTTNKNKKCAVVLPPHYDK